MSVSPARGQAALRLGHRRGRKGRSTRSCRRSSTCSRRCSTSPTTPPAPGYLGSAAPPREAGRRRPRPDAADCRRRRPVRRPPRPARPSSTSFRRAVDGAAGRRHGQRLPPGLRRADLEQGRRGPRRRRARTRGSATATAAARSNHLGDGAPLWNDQLLIARRLVEAGARCVTVAYGFWDTHGNNFHYLKQHLPLFDQGDLGPGRGHPRARPRQGRDGRRLGRVRPDAEDQQGRRPRPLGAGQRRPAGRRRHEGRPGDRLDRQARRPTPRATRSTTRTSWPRSTTTWASTRTRSSATSSGRPVPILPGHGAADRAAHGLIGISADVGRSPRNSFVPSPTRRRYQSLGSPS